MIIRLIKVLTATLLFTIITMFFTQADPILQANNKKIEKDLYKNLTSEKLVAHACGEFNGMTYTNSLNALDSNYKKGFRLFEADFSLTSDNKIVLIHDWSVTAKRLFGTSGKIYTYKRFKKTKSKYNIALMDVNSLISWLKKHNDAYIVTDCKVNGLYTLKDIGNNYPDMKERFYIQMGFFDEYAKLRELGYNNIILALYKSNYEDNQIIKFVNDHNIFAVSMGVTRAETGLPLKLKELNIKVFAHVVNSLIKYKQLLNSGVYGIYTDSVQPDFIAPIRQ